jgi:hypothetical protein
MLFLCIIGILFFKIFPFGKAFTTKEVNLKSNSYIDNFVKKNTNEDGVYFLHLNKKEVYIFFNSSNSKQEYYANISFSDYKDVFIVNFEKANINNYP